MAIFLAAALKPETDKNLDQPQVDCSFPTTTQTKRAEIKVSIEHVEYARPPASKAQGSLAICQIATITKKLTKKLQLTFVLKEAARCWLMGSADISLTDMSATADAFCAGDGQGDCTPSHRQTADSSSGGCRAYAAFSWPTSRFGWLVSSCIGKKAERARCDRSGLQTIHLGLKM